MLWQQPAQQADLFLLLAFFGGGAYYSAAGSYSSLFFLERHAQNPPPFFFSSLGFYVYSCPSGLALRSVLPSEPGPSVLEASFFSLSSSLIGSAIVTVLSISEGSSIADYDGGILSSNADFD